MSSNTVQSSSSLLHAGVVARVLADLAIAALALQEWDHLAPESVWWMQEGSFVGIDGRALPHKVGGHGFLKLGLLENLPEGEGYGCEQ